MRSGGFDPKTGRSGHVALGDGSAPHGVIVGPDGAPWITDGGLNAIVRVDPRTRRARRFPLPSGREAASLNTATTRRLAGSSSPSPGWRFGEPPEIILAMGRTLDELLDDARARIERLTPSEALAAAEIGALIIDIRSDLDRGAPESCPVPSTSRARFSNGEWLPRALGATPTSASSTGS